MPVYEYECNGCGKILEMQQRIADPPLSACPECGGEVRKLISMSSFQLKGGGWYNDGYSASSAAACGADKNSSTGAATEAAPPCQSGGSCCHCPAAS